MQASYFTCVNIFVYVVLQLLPSISEDQSLCYGCELFKTHIKKQAAQKKRHISQVCPQSCPDCPLKLLQCNDGVSQVMDGCKCCYMCARQHGDMCSIRDICDTKKGLYCDISRGQTHGVCRAANAKPCRVGSSLYADGRQFKLDCKTLCTCQNGRYGCVNLCPQEQRPPDKSHCPNARLTEVRGQCCEEWTCEESYDELENYQRNLQSANLVLNHQSVSNDDVSSKHSRRDSEDCSKEATKWTPCSVTCGVGISTRYAPKNCQKLQTRLCYLRPCGYEIPSNTKCTPTNRSFERRKIKFKECESVRGYRFKFCTTCKKNRCCYPRKQKTRNIEFLCNGNRKKTLKFAWIKRCVCSKKCRQTEKNLDI